MTYLETLDYIHKVNSCFCKPGLERIRLLCEALGHPERELTVIHVAGTNGKGSVCAMLDSILRASGRRVGLYTSPYIRHFNERMQVDGKPISDEELVELTARVRPIADRMEDKPTEFELITAIAFEFFRKHQCDVVVLEVGLGGRLDSTNIINTPCLSVITGISLDHTAFLGDTVEKIAAEKAGIDSYTLISYPKEVNALGMLLNLSKESYIEARTSKTLGQFKNEFNLIYNLEQINNLQARLPYEIHLMN